MDQEFIAVTVPRVVAGATDVSVADGCTNNSNYYTDPNDRGTCCCSCDKDIEG